MTVTLYDYFRSGSAYRTRIALNLKGIPYQHHAVHLTRDGGEQHSDAYKAINPQERVPSLCLEDGTVLTQSPAILEWLEEVHPEPPLLPKDPIARAKVRAVAAIVGCDIHPLNNLSVLSYLRGPLDQDEASVRAWIATWIERGFAAIEELVEPGPFCFGEHPTMADLYLVPQVFGAARFSVPLDAFPKIMGIDAACAELAAFKRAHPSAQPDAVAA